MKIVLILICAVAALSCEGPMGPAGPPGDPTGSLGDPSIMPKVIHSYPAANTTGPYPELYRYDCGFEWCYYYSQFQVRFNKFMDLTSVRRSVRLYSPDGNINADTNFIISVGGDVFILNPVDSNGYRSNFRFQVGAPYSIAVDSTARDINGNALAPPFTATFVPEPYFRVMEVQPQDGDVNVSAYTYPQLRFNSKVSAAILTHLTVEPVTTGNWWLGYDSTSVGFQPTTLLPTATEFTLTLDGSAEDARGNRIPAPFTSRFTTRPFSVMYVSPWDGATGISLNASVMLHFSVPIDTSTFRSAFSLSPATSGIIYGLNPGSTSINFAPQDGLLASTTFTIRIDTTLRDLAGSRLAEGFESSFTTAPFSILSTFPQDGSVGVSPYNLFYVYTDAPLNEAAVAGSLQISPSIPVTVIMCDGCSYFYFYVPAGFAANTTYSVTIGTGLSTKRGQTLPAPYTYSFTTGAN